MATLEHVRRQKDQFFQTDQQSPLTPDQQQTFHGLRYFPGNPALRFTLKVEEFPEKSEIVMQTSTGETRQYVRYGTVSFPIDGQQATLTIYATEHGFFLPFTDALAGEETYAAGRYLDPVVLEDGRLLIDFNLAYNPYCAYNDAWSCPITPLENRLKVPIRAGEKLYKDSRYEP